MEVVFIGYNRREKNLGCKIVYHSELIMRPKKISKMSVSTVTSPKFTKWLIVMDTDSLGGQEPENKTNNFGRCTLGGNVLN